MSLFPPSPNAKFRESIRQRDGDMCQYCYLHGDDLDRVDRAVPLSEDNCVWACKRCIAVGLLSWCRTFEGKKHEIRDRRNIPEDNVTVVTGPKVVNPFQKKHVKKWTYVKREHLRR